MKYVLTMLAAKPNRQLIILFVFTALETLVQHKISGFPVVDDTGKLVSAHQNFTLFNLFLLTLQFLFSKQLCLQVNNVGLFSRGNDLLLNSYLSNMILGYFLSQTRFQTLYLFTC